MTRITLSLVAFAVSFASAAVQAASGPSRYQQIVPNTTLTIETSNNTAAANSFPGCEITTVTHGVCVDNGDLKASNVSKVNIHTLLSPSQQGAKIYTTYIPYWVHGTHPNIGYSSQDPHQVTKEINDLTSRGFDGVIIDWYGPGSYEEAASEVLKTQLEQQSTLSFALMIDQGALQWFSCYPGCSATQALLNTIAFARSNGYFSSPAAIRDTDGRLIVTQFGMEAYSINWTTIENANPDLKWVFENAGAFNNSYDIGAYGWLSPKYPLQQGYEGLDYTQYFLEIANQHPSDKNWASSWKGFNDVVANWAPPGGRHIQQFCGHTWIDSWTTIRNWTGRLDAVQVVTWHDYEEGTEIQSGIDNCLTITANVSGSIFSWQVSDSYTVHHYTPYISIDGQNLMSLNDVPVGTTAIDLSTYNFPPGTYQVFVKAVGAPSVRNTISAAATYVVGRSHGTPAVTITSPYNGQHSGPYTNLNANGSSSNGPITLYQVFVDGTWVRNIPGGPSFRAWVPTGMGNHTITVKAEDSAQQWGSANVWIDRAY